MINKDKLEEMQSRANDIDRKYRSDGGWGLREYSEGLVGDVGDLMKLVMAKHGLRDKADIDLKLEHEANDIMWCVLMLYRELGIKDPHASFMNAMEKLSKRIEDGNK